jgi:hypothetical protein
MHRPNRTMVTSPLRHRKLFGDSAPVVQAGAPTRSDLLYSTEYTERPLAGAVWKIVAGARLGALSGTQRITTDIPNKLFRSFGRRNVYPRVNRITGESWGCKSSFWSLLGLISRVTQVLGIAAAGRPKCHAEVRFPISLYRPAKPRSHRGLRLIVEASMVSPLILLTFCSGRERRE